MAVSAKLAELAGYFTRRNPPASEEAIQAFVAQAGFSPPDDYLEFMRQCDGAYGEGESLVFLYSLAEAIEQTQQAEGRPAKMIVFGSDGGHVQYLFDGRGKKAQIVSLSVHDEVTQAQKLGPTLEKALAKLRTDREKAEEQMVKRSKLPPLSPPPAGKHGEVARLACKQGKEFSIRSITFSPDSSHLALAGDFGIQVWFVQGWRQVAQFPRAEGEFTASDMHVDPDAGTVLSAHNECLLLQSFRERRLVRRHDQAIESMQRCLTHDARHLVRTLPDGSLTVVDAQTGAERPLAPDDGRSAHGLIRVRDGILASRFASDSQQMHLDLWQPAKAKKERSMVLPPHIGLNAYSVLEDGRLLLLDFSESRIVDLKKKALEEIALPFPQTRGTLGCCVAVPGTSRIAVAMYESVALFDLKNFSLVEQFDFGDGGGPTLMEASPDGRWLITAGIQSLSRKQFVVRVWRIA